VNVNPAIVGNIAGMTMKSFDGGRGRDGGHPMYDPDGGKGGNGREGGAAIFFAGTLPPLDIKSSPTRVMPFILTGGRGGDGGKGGNNDPALTATALTQGPWDGGPGGNGGRGGDVALDATLDSSAGEPAQYIVELTPGSGGRGGRGGYPNGRDGTDGRAGTTAMRIVSPAHHLVAAVAGDAPAPLLQYALVTSPNPLQTSVVGASITLVISSNQRDFVTCTEIDVALPAGTDAASLIGVATGIQTVRNPGWTVTDQGGGSFQLKPETNADGKIGGSNSLVFTFARLTINDPAGTAAIAISEFSALGSDTPVERDTTVNAYKFPREFSLSPLLAHPTEVPYNTGTTLTWSGTPDATYTLSYDPGNGLVTTAVANTGNLPTAGLLAPTTFTLGASLALPGHDHPLLTQRQTSVTIAPQLSITSFTTSMTAFGAGETILLAWRTILASSCSITVQGLSGSVDVSSYGSCLVTSPHGDSLTFTTTDGATVLGTITVPDSATALTFMLVASGGGASVEAYLYVQLLLARINRFDLRRTWHWFAFVTWATTNAVDVMIDNTAVAPSGHDRVKDPFGQHALRCRGFGGLQNDVKPPGYSASLANDDDAPLLDYALLVNPDPLQASVQNAILTLVVSSAQRDPVNCASIMVTFPLGTVASTLTTALTGMQTQTPDGWTATDQGSGTLSLTPQTAKAGTIGDQPLIFVFSRITVNDAAGTCAISIDETASTPSQPSEDRGLKLTVAKFPQQFHVSELTADSLDVPAGGSATLRWTGSSAGATYTMQYQPHDEGPPVNDPVGNNGPYVSTALSRASSVTFTLIVAVTVPGLDHPLIVQRQASVNVETLTLAFDVQPPTVGVNGLVKLHWIANNATSCQLNPGPPIAASGTLYLVVQKTTIFTLTANGHAGGLLQQQRTVTVDPSIAPNITGRQIVGANGGFGGNGNNGFGDAGNGGNGGDGGDAILDVTLPPLDPTGGASRVMPITLAGGSGGAGGNGGNDEGADPGPIGPGGNAGNGGRGGDATLNATLDESAGAPAQFIIVMAAGNGAAGGQGGDGTNEGSGGSHGRQGIVSMLINGVP
jgi:hypothetical protein